MPLTLTRPVSELTDNEAGILVDLIDRGIAIDADKDDLLLVASGHGKLLREGKQPHPGKRCEICGKNFSPLRNTALTCSQVCRQRRTRMSR